MGDNREEKGAPHQVHQLARHALVDAGAEAADDAREELDGGDGPEVEVGLLGRPQGPEQDAVGLVVWID